MICDPAGVPDLQSCCADSAPLAQVKGMQAEYERVTSKSADSATSEAKEEADSYKAQVDKLIRDKERMQVCMWGRRLGVGGGACSAMLLLVS